MKLRTIDPRNYETALEITVRPDEADLAAPAVRSLADAYVFGSKKAASGISRNSL